MSTCVHTCTYVFIPLFQNKSTNMWVFICHIYVLICFNFKCKGVCAVLLLIWRNPYYSWCNQVLWSPQMVRKIPPGGGTSNQRCHLQLEVGPPIRGGTSNWRCHLWLEVGPPIRGGTSNWRWLMHVGPHRGPHVTCRIQLFFWKKKRLFIVDYIKPSPVYQVKCKLGYFYIYLEFSLKQNNIFLLLDKLSPDSVMASSRSEENVVLNNFQHKRCISVGYFCYLLVYFVWTESSSG